MLKKTITYNDLDGNSVTEDFWFHLSKAELAKMELMSEKGFSDKLQAILDAKDNEQIIKTFQEIITMSFGRRSEDGKSFLKNDAWVMHFVGTEAFSELFIELLTDAKANVEFIKGIVPTEFADKVGAPVVASPDNVPSGERTIEQYTREELLDMKQEDFDRLAGTDVTKWSPTTLQIAYQRKTTAGQA